MDVQDLIELLQKCPRDYEVWIVRREELGKKTGGGQEIEDVVIELNLETVSIVRDKKEA